MRLTQDFLAETYKRVMVSAVMKMQITLKTAGILRDAIGETGQVLHKGKEASDAVEAEARAALEVTLQL